jgi:hypothetical protein
MGRCGPAGPTAIAISWRRCGNVIIVSPRAWGFDIAERRRRVIIGPGPASEHACLYCPERDPIADDQMLPKNAPKCEPVATRQRSGPARQLRQRPGGARQRCRAALHNLPFYGLHTRIDQLSALHQRRVADIVRTCAHPRTSVETLPILFRRTFDRHRLGVAIGETMAHLARAVAAGQLARSERQTGYQRFKNPKKNMDAPRYWPESLAELFS